MTNQDVYKEISDCPFCDKGTKKIPETLGSYMKVVKAKPLEDVDIDAENEFKKFDTEDAPMSMAMDTPKKDSIWYNQKGELDYLRNNYRKHLNFFSFSI